MRLSRTLFPLALIGALGLCAPPRAFAQAGGAYNLEWNTLASGGASFATGGTYLLGGAAGQPDAGPMAGGTYALAGGFWTGGSTPVTNAPGGGDAVPRVFAARIQGSNPFRDATAIQFDLPAAAATRVAVYGVDGRLVRTLASGTRASGRHTVHWDGATADGRPLSPGIYFARIEAGSHRTTLRIARIH